MLEDREGRQENVSACMGMNEDLHVFFFFSEVGFQLNAKVTRLGLIKF